MKNWQNILNKFADVRVLVVGDVMLDRYFWGTVSRISPEAPVPVVKLEKITQTPGGAANVAANAASLGAKAFLVGAIGADESGRALPQVLAETGVGADYLVKLKNRPTTCKTRVIAHSQQLVRVDDEDSAPLNAEQAEIVWRRIQEILPQTDIVILSDYGKGCLCEMVLANTIETARKLGKAVLVDPKGKNYLKYRGATLLTPNKGEAAAASGIEITDDYSCKRAGDKLLAELELESVLITLGEDGMRLFEKNQDSKHFPTMARKVYDVTGAGDTVIATLAIALGAGADLATAAQIANAAAGLAVEQVGTAAVKLSALYEQLKEVEPQ
ncbi:MAG: D-glycero-beta-D-manno-heptose-7-phosphate kinase [Pyrinomonadaceae bacterium]